MMNDDVKSPLTNSSASKFLTMIEAASADEILDCREQRFENLTFESATIPTFVDLSQTVWNGAEFRDCVFYGVNFRASVWEDCKFENCLFVGCSFYRARMIRHQIRNSRFFHGDLRDLRALDSIIHNSDFSLLNMSGGRWSDLKISRSTFLDIDARASDLDSCSFSNCRLIRHDLDETTFKGTSFRDSEVIDTSIRLSNALDQSCFVNCRLLHNGELVEQ